MKMQYAILILDRIGLDHWNMSQKEYQMQLKRLYLWIQMVEYFKISNLGRMGACEERKNIQERVMLNEAE